MRKVFAAVLVLSLFRPGASRAEASATARTAAQNASAAQNSSGPQGQQSVRPQRARQRSYQRETRPRHRISKQEWLFLGAIAGTSMGIGAIAAGGKGVAIGALVGGWGAYAGHRIWKWVK